MPSVLRTHVEMVRCAVAGRLDPRARERRAQVEEAIVLPRELPSRGASGQVWGVTLVRDEADIVEATIRHQMSQGLDAILVADNGSTDGTSEILRSLAGELPVYVAHDALESFLQAEKMTHLAGLAHRAGASWVLPFDADEFWFARETTVAEFLREASRDVVTAPVHGVYPVDRERPDRVVDVHEVWRLDLTPVGRHKVAFRSHRLATLTQGSHNVRRGGRRGPGLVVAHLPWRSEAQLARKLRRGKRAVESTHLGPAVSRHYRALGGSDDREMRAIWEAVVDGRSVEDLYWAPMGPFREAAVLEWPNWPRQV